MSTETVVSVDEVNALVASGLEESDLVDLIHREEGRLAARLGTPLTGSVSLSLRPMRRWDPLLLPRLPLPDTIDVSDVGGPVTIDVSGAAITRRDGHPWAIPTDVAFELGDIDEVKGVLIDLIRVTITASPYLQESTEGHSSTRGATAERTRAQIVNQLNPHRRRNVSVPQ